LHFQLLQLFYIPLPFFLKADQKSVSLIYVQNIDDLIKETKKVPFFTWRIRGFSIIKP